MKIFADTADIDDIRQLANTGLLDGVTTNPTLIRQSGRSMQEVIGEICDAVSGPVSAEVVATTADGMVEEGKILAAIRSNVTIKVPLTWDGLKACRRLSSDGHDVNVTLCFSANQALLAAKAGAAFVSPFVGRLDDIGENGIGLIRDIRAIFDNYEGIETELLAASIRTPIHITQSAQAGADVATVPAKLIRQMVEHPLTSQGLEKFLTDWASTSQVIA